MKKALEYVKQHKKIIIVSLLLAALIVIAVVLYGSSAKTKVAINQSVRTETETKLMNILSEIEGVGQSEVMITQSDDGIDGIIIVCEGADNIITRNNVLNAVTAVFKVEKSNIAIYAMK